MERQLLRFKVHYQTVNAFGRLLIENLTLDPLIVGDRFVDLVAFATHGCSPRNWQGAHANSQAPTAAFKQSAITKKKTPGAIVPRIRTIQTLNQDTGVKYGQHPFEATLQPVNARKYNREQRAAKSADAQKDAPRD